MSVIFLFLGALGAGFVLILLIAIGSPRPGAVELGPEASGNPLVGLDSEQLGKLVAALLDRMGLELERISGGPGEILEIRAVNPTPVTGGTLLVHCVVPPAETGRLDGVAVGAFIRAMRSAYVSKGLLFTTGTITPDGRLAAEDTPVELFDRDQIMVLVDRYFGEDRAHEDLPRLISRLPPATPQGPGPTSS